MATTPNPPGAALGFPASVSGVTYGQMASRMEDVPELIGTQRWRTLDRMTNDAQVWGLYSGTVQPILQYDWWIDPNGCDPAMVAPLAEDLGLPTERPVEGTPVLSRFLGQFDFAEHLQEALWFLVYGSYYFEMWGDIVDGLWRLGGVGPRHPSSIAEVKTLPDGSLEFVRQSGAVVRTSATGTLWAGQAPKIPAARLLPYVWGQQATDRWIGRSILRPIYRDWLVKDFLIRVDSANHERGGGMPWVETDDTYAGADLDDLQRLAEDFRVGEGGAALPPGSTMKFTAVNGGDVIGSIRYHDEQMAISWGSMVRQLGTTATGSRALGETFSDLEAMARRSIAGQFSSQFTRWLVQRWWVWNYGEDQKYAPILRFAPQQIEGSDEAVPLALAPGDSPAPQRSVDVTTASAPARSQYWSRGCNDA